MHSKTRRRFIKNSLIVGSVAPLGVNALPSISNKESSSELNINVFSKHLQFLNYADMAEAAKDIGFDGVDLTVRPKGHVLPERVADDLPRAAEALKGVGFAPNMMVTRIDDATTPVNINILETAAKLGFNFYRMNALPFNYELGMEESLEKAKKTVAQLGDLNKSLGIMGCYQNHSGTRIGAAIWDLWEILKLAGKDEFSVQYDIRHAVTDGGLSWENGFKLVHSRIKTIAIKDVKWELRNGKWRANNVPIGEGMVDFKKYFGLLKKYKINVPVSIHYEYPLGGAEHGAYKLDSKPKVVFDAMKSDLEKVRTLWKES